MGHLPCKQRIRLVWVLVVRHLRPKAPVTTNTANEFEPLTTVHVYDYSSSYAGKVKDSLRLSKKIIEANEKSTK